MDVRSAQHAFTQSTCATHPEVDKAVVQPGVPVDPDELGLLHKRKHETSNAQHVDSIFKHTRWRICGKQSSGPTKGKQGSETKKEADGKKEHSQANKDERNEQTNKELHRCPSPTTSAPRTPARSETKTPQVPRQIENKEQEANEGPNQTAQH